MARAATVPAKLVATHAGRLRNPRRRVGADTGTGRRMGSKASPVACGGRLPGSESGRSGGPGCWREGGAVRSRQGTSSPGSVPEAFPLGPDVALVPFVSDLRKTERPAEQQSAPISNLELDGRRDELRSRYPGLKVEGNLEPSNQVLTEHGRQFEADQLRYVPWSMATKRKTELLSTAASKRPDNTGFEEDSRGYIRRVPQPLPDVADSSTDLLLLETLTRRGLSADAMRLMTWGGVGDTIVVRLMEEYRAEAVTPHHAPISLDQVRRADEHIWTRLAELASKTKGGIRPRPDGALPLDGLVEKVGGVKWLCSVRGVFAWALDGPQAGAP